jgi:endogenous inhibitor of DNA gyrase (YacG/DUF329 family)
VECPQCGGTFEQRTGRGRPKRFCSDECRQAFNGANATIANEIAWLRDRAEDSRSNAARSGYRAGRASWLNGAARHDAEADRLERILLERKGKTPSASG